MKTSLIKAAAAVTIAATAVFAPVAANAAAGAGSYTTPTTIITNNIIVINFAPGSFASFENVNIYLTGVNADDATLATVKAATNTTPQLVGTVTADADGGATARIQLPAGAAGNYTILGTSPSNPAGISATVTLAAAGGGTGGTGGLPATGMDSGSLLGLWVGGGALVLAGGAVAAGAAVHRQRKQAA
jgi:hypothetical protein